SFSERDWQTRDASSAEFTKQFASARMAAKSRIRVFPTRLRVHRRTIGSSVLFALYVLCSGAALAAADAPSAMPPGMDERVRACTSCHGAQGQGRNDDYFPRIAGKPADYLFNQLTAFRDGGRTYPPMGYLLAFLPDDYLRQI